MGSLYWHALRHPAPEEAPRPDRRHLQLAGKVGIPGRSATAQARRAGDVLRGAAPRAEGQRVDVNRLSGIVATDIRLHGYGPDGKPAGKSGLKDDKAMSVQECARQILEATGRRKRQLVMTLQGRLGLWLAAHRPGRGRPYGPQGRQAEQGGELIAAQTYLLRPATEKLMPRSRGVRRRRYGQLHRAHRQAAGADDGGLR